MSPRKPSRRDALESALRLLSHRPFSQVEMRRRLSRSFVSDEVDTAIATLEERGLLDDEAFAKFWAEQRERNRPRGVSAIRWEILRMGVARDVADEAVEGLHEEEMAQRAAEKILGRLDPADYNSFCGTLGRYLRRRGFAAETVRHTIESYWEQLSDSVDSHIEGSAHIHHPE